MVRDVVNVRTDSSAYPYPVDVVRRTLIDGISIRDCSVGKASSICSVKGDGDCPVSNLSLDRVRVDVAGTDKIDSSLCPGFSASAISFGRIDPEKAQWTWDVPKPWYAEYDMPAFLPDAKALEALGELGDFRLSFDCKASCENAALLIRDSGAVSLSRPVGSVASYKPLYDAFDFSKEVQRIEITVHRRAISVAVNGFEVVCNERLADFPDRGRLKVRGAEISNVVLEPILGQKY